MLLELKGKGGYFEILKKIYLEAGFLFISILNSRIFALSNKGNFRETDLLYVIVVLLCL